MAKYSEEFKEQVVCKMMPPNALAVAQVRRETGVSEQTLYNWRNQFRQEGKAVPAESSGRGMQEEILNFIQELLGLPGFSDVSLPACHGLRTPPDLHILATSVASVSPSVHVKTLGVRN